MKEKYCMDFENLTYQCRISDKSCDRVMITALGNVDTPLSQGVFLPEQDCVKTPGGEIVRNYYQDKLGVTYFSSFEYAKLHSPPSGWCSWQYYGRKITPDEIMANAEWFSTFPKGYGFNLILIDDGWQGDSRNWEKLSDAFTCGMKQLADDIKSLDLKPGLWICPQGQDNYDIVVSSAAFISEKSKECRSFGGNFTVDPTKPEGIKYLENLMSKVTKEWGYEYLKLDGICSNTGSYGVNRGYVKHHAKLRDISLSPDEVLRKMLQAVKDGGAPDTFVGGCGIMCPEAIGKCHGMRTGSDVDNEWRKGFMNALESTMHGYYLHHFAWFSDPDCCILRPPLSFEMAQAWASLLGLTGQMLLLADRMPDLSPKRVDLIKKIAPSAPIRPFDLFPSSKHKNIIDMKVDRNGRNYDVIGIFNTDESVSISEYVDFSKLGLSSDHFYHVYDFWNEEYLGLVKTGLFAEVQATACKVITIYEEKKTPVLLSTSRHITQGWPDIRNFEVSDDGETIRGTSELIPGEPYSLVFGLPLSEGKTYELIDFTIKGVKDMSVSRARGNVRVKWTARESAAYDWTAKFKEAPARRPCSVHSRPYMTGARDVDPWTIELFWVTFGSPSGYFIKCDGKPIGYSFSPSCRIRGFEYKSLHDFEIFVSDIDGKYGEGSHINDVSLGESLGKRLNLVELEWLSASTGYLMVNRNRSVSGAGLFCGNRRYATGLGTCAPSTIKYSLKSVFSRLTGFVGIEYQNGIPSTVPDAESGEAMVSIYGDGNPLMESAVILHGRKPLSFDVDVSNIDILELRVEEIADKPESLAPHTDWLDVVLYFLPTHKTCAGEQEENSNQFLEVMAT